MDKLYVAVKSDGKLLFHGRIPSFATAADNIKTVELSIKQRHMEDEGIRIVEVNFEKGTVTYVE